MPTSPAPDCPEAPIEPQNADRIIASSTAALQALEELRADEPDAMPEHWLALHHMLARAYHAKSAADPQRFRGPMIRHASLAQLATDPEDLGSLGMWADRHIETASMLLDERFAGTDEDLVLARRHFAAAETVYKPTAHPEEFAKLQILQAQVLAGRTKGDRPAQRAAALEHLARATTIVTIGLAPGEKPSFDLAQGNLALSDPQGDGIRNYEDAILHYRRAAQGFQQLGDQDGWARAEASLGAAFAERPLGLRDDNLTRSIEHYEHAAEVMTEAADPGAFAQLQLSRTTALRRKAVFHPEYAALAIAAGEAALRVFREHGARALEAQAHVNLALAHTQRGSDDRNADLEAALGHLESAMTHFATGEDPEARARTLHNRGLVFLELRTGHLRDNLTRAAADFREALQVYTAEAHPLRHVNACLELGKALSRLQQWDEALEAFTSALQLSERLAEAASTPQARREIVERVGNLVGAAGLCLVELGSAQEAFELMRDGRRRLTREMLGGRSKLPPRLEETGSGDQGVLVVPMFGYGAGALIVLPPAVDKVLAEHVVRLPDCGLDEVRRILKGRTDDGRTCGGWLAGLEALVNDDVDGFREEIAKIGPELWTAIGAALEQKLRDLDVPLRTRVRLAPQGGLGLLPFHIAGPAGEAGAELLESFAFSYVVDFASSPEPLRVAEAEALIVADPGEDLPFAEFECTAVARRLDHRRTRLLLRQQATMASVRQSEGANLLHFACHGRFDWDDPLASALELADGRLTLAEIADEWRFPPRSLVMLSACESGITKFGRAPDASLGLPAGLLAAGADWVLATLWQVNDVASALLIDRVYHELGDGETEPSNALRKAQLWLRGTSGEEIGALLDAWRSLDVSDIAEAQLHHILGILRSHPEKRHFADPYFWAGFVVVA